MAKNIYDRPRPSKAVKQFLEAFPGAKVLAESPVEKIEIAESISPCTITEAQWNDAKGAPQIYEVA